MAETLVPKPVSKPTGEDLYNAMYAKLTNEGVGGRTYDELYNSVQEAETGAYKKTQGYPFIFTAGDKKSSAFGPLQITYSTTLGYFYPGKNEDERRANMTAGKFKSQYKNYPQGFKDYIKNFVEQGINKVNQKGGAFGSLGVGNINRSIHDQYYPMLAAVHINEKKKIAKDDSVEGFVNAHFGKANTEDKKEQLANLQTKVSNFLKEKDYKASVTAADRDEQAQQAAALEIKKASQTKPEPIVEPEPVVEQGTTDTQEPVYIEDEKNNLQVEPEESSVFEKAYEGIKSLFGQASEEEVQKAQQTRESLLQTLRPGKTGPTVSGVPQMNEGGMIDYSVVDDEYELPTPSDKARGQMKAMGLDAPSILSPKRETRTATQVAADRKALAEMTPVVGDAMLAKDVADYIGEGSYQSAAIGTAALGVGMIPGPVGDALARPIGKVAKALRKKDAELADKLIKDDKALTAWKKENKVSQKQKRVPEVQEAAQALTDGKITSKEYRHIVKGNQPINPITSKNFPELPTKTEIVGALKATDSRKVETGVVGLNKIIKDGTRVGSRLDIPAYEKYNKWIVSLHDGEVLNGKSIGYGQTAVLKDVEFISSAKGGVNIAKGKDKTTIARIHGDYQNAEPENVFEAAKQLIDDPEWTQVGMNPFRHSYFYDKATGNPVLKADEVIQVGPLVLAKGVKKPTLSEMKEMIGGKKVVKDDKVTYKGAVRTTDGKIRTFNEGGMAIEKQMEMFEEGGLKDEGGTVDPVSGNDVPPGSMQEEVRDDIPAQLSEGEFVFPADVVRYIGLEKLMQMRQEAKMGLQRMEDMGQMGNSDEAIMPDNLPFTLDDLDMEDEPQMFQAGGVVQPVGFTGISGMQPSQFMPQQPQQTYTPPPVPQPYVPTQQAAVPTMAVPQTLPTFAELMPSPEGQYDELVEYENTETGQKMTIPFVDGKPIYPIPQGFTRVQTDIVEPTEISEDLPSTQVDTATVREDDPSDESDTSGGATVSFGGVLNKKTGKVEEAFTADLSFGGDIGMPQSFMFGRLGGKPLPQGATATISNVQLPRPEGVYSSPRDTLSVNLEMDAATYNDLIYREERKGSVTSRTELAEVMEEIENRYGRDYLENTDATLDLTQILADKREREAEEAATKAAQARERAAARAAQKIADEQARQAELDRIAREREQRVLYGAGSDEDSGDSGGTAGAGADVGRSREERQAAGISDGGAKTSTPGGFGGTGRGRSDIGMASGGLASKAKKTK